MYLYSHSTSAWALRMDVFRRRTAMLPRGALDMLTCARIDSSSVSAVGTVSTCRCPAPSPITAGTDTGGRGTATGTAAGVKTKSSEEFSWPTSAGTTSGAIGSHGNLPFPSARTNFDRTLSVHTHVELRRCAANCSCRGDRRLAWRPTPKRKWPTSGSSTPVPGRNHGRISSGTGGMA